MSKEIEYFEETGKTLYAKESPLDTSTWANGVEALTEDTVTGYYHTDIASPVDEYVIFEQSGGSPASTDVAIGNVKIGHNMTKIEGSGTVDTLSLTSLFELVIAFMAGQTAVTDLGGGNKRIIMDKQDGTTEKLRIDFNSDGEWTATTVS